MTTESHSEHHLNKHTTVERTMMAVYLRLCVVVMVTVAKADGRCRFAAIQANANKCLSDHMMEEGTEFIMPIVHDSDGVINLCTRSISDIKNCITSVISTCAADKKVRAIFGPMGSALLAAYDGICAEEHSEEDLTCVYQGFYHGIKELINQTFAEIDHEDIQSGTLQDICAPLNNFHTRIMGIYDEAIAHEHCTEDNKHVIHKYLSTVVFPCENEATPYYPCTLQRLDTDIWQCYSKYGATVKSGLVPIPTSLSHAGEICLDGVKGLIQICIKNLIRKCLHEPQVATIFDSAAEPFMAAYECMCSLDNSDMVLTCASSANVTSVASMFMKTIHNLTVTGLLDRTHQCKATKAFTTQLMNIVYGTCTDVTMRSNWRMYIGTVFYRCLEETNSCYPHNTHSGAQTSASLRDMFYFIFAGQMLGYALNAFKMCIVG